MGGRAASQILESATASGTVGAAFRHAATLHPDRVAVRTLDDEVSMTWRTLQQRVDALAGGLTKLGLRRGDTLVIMLNNRTEFHLVDLATVTVGATPFSIYQTLAPEQIAYVVSDAGARVAVIETAFLSSFGKAMADLPALEHVVVIDGDGTPGMLRLDQVEGSNPGFDADACCKAIRSEDLLTLIYTSGTTGPPKGVQLSHRNLIEVVRSVAGVLDAPDESRAVSWLPTAHIAERALNYYLPLLLGATITCCPNPREIIASLPKVQPTHFFAVPRIWEKLKAGLEAQLAAQPAEQRSQMEQALHAAVQKVRLTQAGKPVPPDLAEQVAAADATLFSRLRTMLGLAEARAVFVGAAPTSLDVLEFFHAIGIQLAEGWGMSETSGVGTVNPPGKIKLGTVGPPLPGIEVRLAGDGEILIRGPNIMVGYRNQPERTAETISRDGWLVTGDIGEIDADGYLKIVDRKKELIINAAGKNMSPANIESALKGSSPLIGQACVIGDRRPYNTALIVLDPDYLAVWARQQGLSARSLEELAKAQSVIAAVQVGVDTANAKLSRVEQIKKFAIIPNDWPPAGDELTPTMKLKRRPIAEKYKVTIESMY